MNIAIYTLIAALWISLILLVIIFVFYRKSEKVLETRNQELKEALTLNENEKLITQTLRTEIYNLKLKYLPIIDIDQMVQNIALTKANMESALQELNNTYQEKKLIFDSLVEQVAIYDEEIMLAELGFYKPHFDFDTSEKYKNTIKSIKEQQKDLITKGQAIYSTTEWTVDGSKIKGATFTKKIINLTARAFNNECDAGVANVRWNNILRIEQRIIKAFETINKLNLSSKVVISSEYLTLKLVEIRLAYEHADKKKQERDEQAEILRQIREEALLKEDQEKALLEELKYKTLLDKAKLEVENTSGHKLEQLEKQIYLLSEQLNKAHVKSERAKSMAQQTKAGHVYIISNIGSFGDNIYKIGMTRRLDPLDRVRELGDASVPFTFDVHAMIYTENAPSLENNLHRAFEERRINLVNNKKEFFDVSLDEIQKEVLKIAPNSEFYLTAEAREHRQSLAIKAQRDQKRIEIDIRAQFPEVLLTS